MSNYSTTAKSLPKKIKLIRDKYPDISGAGFRLVFSQKTYVKGNDYLETSYVSKIIEHKDLVKEKEIAREAFVKKQRVSGFHVPPTTYHPFYLSGKGTKISIENYTDTDWFEPIEEEPIVMTMENIEDKLGIKNLIIK